MENREADPGRYRPVRALAPGDDAPWLVEDPADAGKRRVLRPVPEGAVAAAVLFRGVRHEGLAELLRLEDHPKFGLVTVSAWVDGEDFGVVGPRLDGPERLAIVHDVASALLHLHELGLTHGDLKPGNVIVTPGGRGVLIDPAGPDGGVRGSLPYMAPERILRGPPTASADLYALGGVLFFALTGRAPHEGTDPLTLVRAVLAGPPDLEAPTELDPRGVLTRLARALLAREPSLRPHGVRVVVRDLAVALGRDVDLPRQRTPLDALAATPPTAPEVLLRAGDRFFDRVLRARERVPVLAITGPAGSGRTTALDALSERTLVAGALALRVSSGDEWPDLDRALARGLPVVVLVDDVHVATTTRRAALREWLERPPRRGGRFGVVVAGEHDETLLALPGGRTWRGVEEDADDVVLELPPLAARELADRLRRALPSLVAPDALADRIVTRTGGHAASAFGLLLRFARDGGIEQSGGATIADPAVLDGLESETPDAVHRHLGRLAPEAREVVSLLSRAGVPVAAVDLSAALRRPVADVLRSLHGLERDGIVRSTRSHPPRVVFAFPAERDAVRAATRIHADTAIRLARRLASRGGRAAETLDAVAHLLGAGGRAAASRYFLRAARARFAAGEAHAAVENLERAAVVRGRVAASGEFRRLRARALAMAGDVEPADRALAVEIDRAHGAEACALILDRVHLLERSGRAAEAIAVYDAATSRTDLGDSRALEAARAWSLFAAGQEEAARRAIARLQDRVAPDERNPAALETHAVAAAILDRSGARREARASAVAARRIARALGRSARAAHFDSTLGVFDIDLGREERGLGRIRRAVHLLERVDDRRLLPDTLVRLGYQLLRHADAAGALDAFVRAGLMFARAGNRRGLGWARTGEGRALLELGDPVLAAERFSQAVEDRLAARSAAGAALAAVHLYIARCVRGDADRARAAAVRALQLSRGEGGAAVRADLEVALAATAAEERDARRLFGHARRAKSRLEAAGRSDLLGRAGALMAAGALACGDVPRAIVLVRHARHAARLARDSGDLARANAVRAAANLFRQRPGVARAAFERAVRLARDPETAVVVRLEWARAALHSVTAGDDSQAASARTACADAEATSAQRGDRLRQGAARALLSALEVASAGSASTHEGRRPAQALRQVLEASRWIHEARSSKDVLNRIIDAALQLTRASRGFVVVKEEGGEEDGPLRFAAARHFRREDILDPEMKLSRSIVDEAITTGGTVVTSEARADERFRATASITDLDLLSVMCAPLMSGARVLGAIYVDDPTRVDRFDELAREHLEALASQAALSLEKTQLLAQVERLNRGLARDLARAKRDLEVRSVVRKIVTRDAAMERLLDVVERVADSDAPVLVVGAPGTGKEMIARALHDSSHRRHRPFVPLNCAALPESLVESELFGYAKGAFSGAQRDREGLVAAADGGTLFLDEVGEMPPSVQAKLLRVLQDGEYLPLGSTVPKTARIRLVSATHRPLKELIRDGRFREDFYYRIKVVQLDVPPLRERRGDVPLLARYFAEQIAAESGATPRTFTDESLRRLARAPWKGNVRELEAQVRALLLTVDHDPIDVDDLPEEFRGARGAPRLGGPLPRLKEAVEARERELVIEALNRAEGHRQKAADSLGITRRWLQKLIEKHGL